MSETNERTNLKFTCACHKVAGSVRVPTSALPLPFDFCHCNVCRHQSGLLCASYLTLPNSATDFSFKGPLVDYKSSDTVTRTFCSHCGANIYFRDSSQPWPDIATGTIDRSDGIIELRNHIFVPDARDGGLTAWISDIPAWKGYAKPHQLGEQLKIGPPTQRTIRTAGHNEVLHAYCHCRGVQFRVTAPNEASKILSSPAADLLSRDASERTSGAQDDAKWWLCAGGTKYLAGTCACQSCRLASGFDIQMWAFIPKVNIVQVNGEPLEFGMGTLQQYKSSKGTYRQFCSTCGATVFWHDDRRPDLIDVSVGLLDATEGARAESWLEWHTERVSFEEESQNQALISRLGVGLRRWGTTGSSPKGKGWRRNQEHPYQHEKALAKKTDDHSVFQDL